MISLEQVHPDDADWATEVFISVVEEGRSAPPLEDSLAGGAHFRMVGSRGEAVPLHATAAIGLGDPYVQGIIYDLRPDWSPDLMSQILAGVAHGEPADELLQRISELVAVPPVPVDVAFVDLSDPGRPTLATVTHDAFADVAGAIPGLVAPGADGSTGIMSVGDLDETTRRPLKRAGYDVVWNTPIRVTGSTIAYHLVAACKNGLRYKMTVFERMQRAASLAAVALMRAENDARVLHAATHDGLTHLPNRSAFYEHVDERVATGKGVTLLYVDLDDFKPVNDRYGHAAGDAMLQEVAKRLRRSARPSDFVARLGGDEFALCLAGPASDTVAEQITTRIQALVAEPFHHTLAGGEDMVVSASAGIAVSRPGVDAKRFSQFGRGSFGGWSDPSRGSRSRRWQPTPDRPSQSAAPTRPMAVSVPSWNMHDFTHGRREEQLRLLRELGWTLQCSISARRNRSSGDGNRWVAVDSRTPVAYQRRW